MTTISELKADGIGGPLQADAIQILGQRTNQSYIESVLNVSECYIISDYSCPELDKYQKVLENDIYIDVGLKSSIQRIPDTITIPKTWFRFVSKSQLIELGEAPPYYPDFIGVLSKIRDCTKANGEPFVLLILSDERRGPQWYCNAHGLIEMPGYIYKLTVIIADTTNTIPAIVFETSCRKLLKSSIEKFISDNPLTNRNTLPSIMTDQKEQTKTMCIQMLRESTPDNICFIIIDIQQSTTPPETPVPTTPGQTLTKRIRSDNETPEASDYARPVVRTLTFTPPVAIVQNTFTCINQTRKNMINEAPVEMPYRHVVVTKTFINELDQDTVVMLDIFQAMQENMASTTEICKKIINDHQVP
ncbi:unnamed protein product [Lactuca saligna]|uniref:Uncharacterized protein n=1 Tax=Lactuca saligna TaxID=75948 RepID=A0AA35ZPH0_LACSI|nr:unnamed protein product [Lactuca saligna]